MTSEYIKCDVTVEVDVLCLCILKYFLLKMIKTYGMAKCAGLPAHLICILLAVSKSAGLR